MILTLTGFCPESPHYFCPKDRSFVKKIKKSPESVRIVVPWLVYDNAGFILGMRFRDNYHNTYIVICVFTVLRIAVAH